MPKDQGGNEDRPETPSNIATLPDSNGKERKWPGARIALEHKRRAILNEQHRLKGVVEQIDAALASLNAATGNVLIVDGVIKALEA